MEKCNWCEETHKTANKWTKNENNTKFISFEKFCSLKCKTEFEKRYSITWQKKSYLIRWVILFIILLFLGITIFNKFSNQNIENQIISNTNSENSRETTTEENNILKEPMILREEEKNISAEPTLINEIEKNPQSTIKQENLSNRDEVDQNELTKNTEAEKNAVSNTGNYRMINYQKHQIEVNKAIEMLKQNKSISEIANSTTLERSEIRQLRRKLND